MNKRFLTIALVAFVLLPLAIIGLVADKSASGPDKPSLDGQDHIFVCV